MMGTFLVDLRERGHARFLKLQDAEDDNHYSVHAINIILGMKHCGEMSLARSEQSCKGSVIISLQ